MFYVATEPTTAAQWVAIRNNPGDAYIQDVQFLVRRNHDRITIIDVQNAYAQGKACEGVSIYNNSASDQAMAQLIEAHEYSLSSLYTEAKKAAESNESGALITKGVDSYTVYGNTRKGIHTFSPLPQAKATLKPLKCVPAKWAIRHVQRLVANDQVTAITKTFRGHKAAEITADQALEVLTNKDHGLAVDGIDNEGRLNVYSQGYYSLILIVSAELTA